VLIGAGWTRSSSGWHFAACWFLVPIRENNSGRWHPARGLANVPF